jgi:hypothetical protein
MHEVAGRWRVGLLENQEGWDHLGDSTLMKSVDWAELAQGEVQGQVYPHMLSGSGNGQNTQAANLSVLSNSCSFNYVNGSYVVAHDGT